MTMPSTSPVPLSDEELDTLKRATEFTLKSFPESIAKQQTLRALTELAELRSLRSSPPSTGHGDIERAAASVDKIMNPLTGTVGIDRLAQLLAAVRGEERERCAKIVPMDVERLVRAARNVAHAVMAPTEDEIKELDAASEAFASRVSWDEDPESENG
jgi:hypothetical protein